MKTLLRAFLIMVVMLATILLIINFFGGPGLMIAAWLGFLFVISLIIAESLE